MKLVKYRPWHSVNQFASIFDELADRKLIDWFDAGVKPTNQPSVNIKETDSAYIIELAAPGLEKGDFNLSVKENNLIISAERKIENEENQDQYKRQEFKFTSFTRSFYLPKEVNIDEIKAEYETGILSVSIPKDKQASDVKKIEIG